VQSPAAAPVPPVRRLQLRASVEQLADMLTALDAFARAGDAEPAFDSRGQLEAMLLQSGFRAGFLSSLDLAGVFAMELGIPAPAAGDPPARPADWDVAAVLAAPDPQRLLASMPDTYRPQPLGGGLWELVDGETHLKLRPRADSVEVGREVADLDRAGTLRARLGPGRRVRGRLWDIPPDWLEQVASEMEPAAPDGSVADLVRQARSVDFGADWGTDRDAVVVLAAEAPFRRLGLAPLGGPVTKESPLAAQLPARAVLAIALSWGDPRLLHRQIDQNIDPARVPAPFDVSAGEAIAGAHALLDQVREEVLLAFYLDRKGAATLLLAGTVADEAATKDAARALLGAAQRAFSAHAALQGDAPEQRYRAVLRRDQSVGGRKVDRLTVTVPGFLRGSVGALSPWLGKKNPQLDAYSWVSGHTAALAIGAGAEAVVRDLGRGPGRAGRGSLESEGGLALARRIDGGCQLCLAVDPVGSARASLVLARDALGNERAGQALPKLDRIRVRGQLAFAVKVEDERGSLGLAVPRDLLSRDAPELWRLIRLLREALSPPEPPAIWEGLGSPPPNGS
jgi:hypothetical protein